MTPEEPDQIVKKAFLNTWEEIAGSDVTPARSSYFGYDIFKGPDLENIEKSNEKLAKRFHMSWTAGTGHGVDRGW